MKHFILAFLLFICTPVFSQTSKSGYVTSSYEVDSNDRNLISLYLLEINTQKYFIPKQFGPYYCDLIMEEYFEGKLLKRESIRDSLPPSVHWPLKVENKLQNGQFPILVYSQARDSIEKIYMLVGGVGKPYKLKRILTNYTWKPVYNLEEKKHPLKADEWFPLFVYSSPVGKEHNQQFSDATEFCLISGEKVPPKDWYKELGIKHFFLFSIRLAEK